MSMQQYCLRWNNHQPNFISVFSNLLSSESLVDVTLSADGRHLQAHKLVLSACSSYFQSLFTINPCQHPIVILKDVKFTDLKVIIDFMYFGEVNVSQDQLPHILKTAEMLKIKGLAEIPVEASVKQQNSTERAELLAHSDSNWNNESNRQSPSHCPLSPGSKRKRLRKSSTGSGTGSSEKPAEEHSNEVTLTSPLAMAVIKSDPGNYNTDANASKQGHSLKHETSGSHESTESRSPHQITLQIPHEIPVQHSTENTSSIEMPGPSTTSQTVTERVIITTHAQISQSAQHTLSSYSVGPKRGRFLIRQPRIKKETDLAGQNTDSSVDTLTSQYLSVPHVRVERQVSDPLPAAASPPPGSLLTVPGSNILMKQHSHPLLPSQISIQTSSPPPISATQMQLTAAHSPLMDESEEANAGGPLRVRSEDLTPTTLKVRTDELKRSVSSPSQSNARSSHCPVVRPGPALGCNYCWNTVDKHGRILRRKTKYHCPECQTNLCIVPCFQEYHERHVHADPIPPATTSTVRVFPKTSSM